jgi:antitoxin VapB
MTAAVTIAVRERLDRLRSEQRTGLAHRLLQIGQDCAKRLKEPYRSVDHDNLLFDDRGLPR